MQFSDLVVPPWCRWNPENPAKLTIWLNLLYACAGGFLSANLFYSHPILAVLARDFNTTQAGVSTIPTLSVAGEATGLLLVLPLADFFPRRRFTLLMMFVTASFWLGLCITTNLAVFNALTYLSACFTGVTQIMIPLVAELSTDDNRAFNISIVGMGPTLAILLARILSGVVANFTSWRNIYWLALGLQVTVMVLLYLFMPDYPATNEQPKREVAKKYPQILWSIVTLYTKYPVLVQSCVLAFCTFFAVGSFWTTLTFLLSESPYNYNTLVIGLFGLIGAATMVLGPMYSRFVIKPLGSPLLSCGIGQLVSLLAVVLGTFIGKFNVAGPVIEALLLDAGLMITSIASRVNFHSCEPKGRNRVNTAYTICLYLGVLCGTKASNVIYEKAGGWIPSGALSIGVLVVSVFAILARGPNEQGWIGWTGGWGQNPQTQVDPEKVQAVETGEKGAVKAQEVDSDVESTIASAIIDVRAEKV